MDKRLLIFCVYLSYHIHSSHGCQMEDVVQWLEPQSFQFKDTHKGLIISRATTNIEAIDRADFFDGLNRGPYLELNLKDSIFTVSTIDAFAEYEEYETLASIRLTVTFRCTGGSTRSLVFMFGIIDTNNHAPVFKLSEPYNFPLALPVPPGFKVSGCDHMVVRDVDLTTSAIIFSIQDNPYFEIVYHGQTQAKEFGASIRTKTLIRSLPDSLSFQISATDVDETTDDPLTSLATVNILADNAFRLPEQPIFSQAFYKAHYSEEPDIVLQEYISLRQGYDDEVKFGIRGEYADFFDLVDNNNRLSFRVKSPLTEDVSEPQILLVVTAEREFTSEASATVVIFLPEAPILIFESTLYEGQVVDNILKAPSLIITQGYGDIRNINIISEYSSYFKTTIKDNMVILSMSPLPTTVIRENNVLNLQVVATTNRNATASTIVVLDIIKDDYITPTFEKTMYEGNYDPDTGLVLDPIVLSRGYDDTVQISLKGDHANYFEKDQNNAVIKLSASIPQQVWSEGSLMITVEATKPRTVGGNTAVYINLPAARELTFEAPYYIGSLENNDLTLESIVLRHGYAPGVSFKLSGEFATYFTTRNIENRVTISLQTQIPETVILDNSGMMLTLSAIGLNALTANTNILLNIIKDDHTTPVFEKTMYNGTYSATGLVIEPIKIVQGLDDTVKYTLVGDHSELFEVKLEGQTISVNGTVPTQIWSEKILFLTLHATKPRTVGAHAIIQIYLPKAREIRFEKSSYIGILRNPIIAIEEIIISTGYSSDLEFMVTGEYAHFFDIINADNKVSMKLITNLPEHILLENNLIIVKISASGLHAVTAFTTIVLDIQKDDTTTPIFSRTIYEGIYKDSLNIYVENIALIQGYDKTVSFGLQGDHAQYFKLDSVGNNITISLKSAIPEEVIFNEKRLLLNMFAEKDLTVGASAVVSFQFPAEFTEPTVMRFSKTTYEAKLEKETFKVTEIIILQTGFKKDTKFMLSGNFAQYFELENSQNIVTILMRNTTSEEVLQMQKFIILQIDAYHDKAVPVSASLIIDVIKSDAIISPVFENPFYSGTFTKENGLKFDEEIRLVSGYEDTVLFELEGDVSEWFSLQINGNSIFILENVDTEIPDEVLELNNQLLFAIVANKPGTDGGRAAISISLPKASISLRFSENYYKGYIEEGNLNLDIITLNESYSGDDIIFNLIGDYNDFFQLSNQNGSILIEKSKELPSTVYENYNVLILTLQARIDHIEIYATLIFEIKSNPEFNNTTLSFEKTYYTGFYSKISNLVFDFVMTINGKIEDQIAFNLEGADATWFDLKIISENSVTLNLKSDIPPEVMTNNTKLIFVIKATKFGSVARATIVISLTNENTEPNILGFEKISYSGTIDKDSHINLVPINLNEGFNDQVQFNLRGELAPYFILESNGPTVILIKRSNTPEDLIPSNGIIILELFASAPRAVPTFATIVLTIERLDNITELLSFADTYYTGSFNTQDGLTFNQLFFLIQGYDKNVVFALQGDDSVWFGLEKRSENSFALIMARPIPPAVLINKQKLVFVITATKSGSAPARSTVIVSLFNEYTTQTILGFEKISYNGSIDKNSLINLEQIILNEGYSDQVLFILHGELASYFKLENNGATVTITILTNISVDLPSNDIIILELLASAPQAVSTFATIVLAVERADDTPISEQLSFAETYYLGRFTIQDGLNFNYLVTLISGYHKNVVFALEGDDSVWFGLDRRSDKSVALTITSHIPPAILENKEKLIFVIKATRVGSLPARATIVISLSDVGSDPFVTFDKLIYNGVVRTDTDTVTHEPITISGFDGTSIKIVGQYSDHFEQSLMNDKLVITLKSSALFPNVSNIALELQANLARAVLLLNIERSETPVLPTVAFSSSSYVMKVDIIHIGLIGQVQATADNGESVKYSLLIDDDHLRNRLSVDSDGHLRLAAPASSGAYSFRALATAAVSGASATAPVHLTVEAVTVCGDNIVMPPLIILERDEEEPHRNLVVLNETTYPGCRFTVSNSWPQDQSWLYVDDSGLHTVAIDREHSSIAFMAQSQIQVELILTCEDDVTSRTKRSLHKADWLGPYDYGSNKWILTDTIPYNARRSLVNLIVNDINDNRPIFVDKELEPIAVGYPVADLEKIIVPRALAELKANDADVGENAALVYWSAEESLAVSPSTGFVHVRNNFNLQNNARLIVHATDRNGAGLTGNLELMVKLLEESRIAVITIQNVFLDDEKEILTNITNAVGYEVKSLRTIVVTESKLSRDTRDTSGVSLQLFVYGLIEREPVEVNQLTADIQNNNIFAVAKTVSLEDHLEGNEICTLPRRDTGLLVATIVLSVLLVILIVVIAVWFFLKWRRNKVYEEFSDKNSLTASRNDSLEQPKVETVAKPRLNIEELKRSERRLQERLDVPVTQVSVQPSKSNPTTLEAKVNITTPETQLPIVIQTIDKLKDSAEDSDDGDEFGEKVKIRRKSVVTFNENVEKIIHVEDNPDNSDYEIFRF